MTKKLVWFASIVSSKNILYKYSDTENLRSQSVRQQRYLLFFVPLSIRNILVADILPLALDSPIVSIRGGRSGWEYVKRTPRLFASQTLFMMPLKPLRTALA